MKHNANNELNTRKAEQRYVARTSLKFWKGQAHKEDRRNARIAINAEI